VSATGVLEVLASAARRRRAAILVALALPLILAAAAVAWRVAGAGADGPATALVVLAVGAAALLGWIARSTRPFDAGWVARQLDDRRPDLEDSASLLLREPAQLNRLQHLQRARLERRLTDAPPPDLRPAWPGRAVALSWAFGAAIATAALLAPPLHDGSTRGAAPARASAPADATEPQLVERSLLSGTRRVWSEGVRVVLSPDDSLLAYSTAPWAGMIDSLVVEPIAGGLPIAAVPGVMIPLAFSPDATQLLIGNGSYASPDHRVLTFADGSLAPLLLGIPPGAVAFEPPFWDARGLLVFHVSGGIDSTIATLRNVTTGIDTVLLRAAEGCLGLTVAWSRDGRYAALFTQKVITVPDQQTPGREVSVWVLDTVVPGVRRIAYTWDAVAGRPLQDYAGTFSPDGTEFAWEAGRTLFLAPVDGER